MTKRKTVLGVLLALFFGVTLAIGLIWRRAPSDMTDAEVVKKNADNFCFS